MADAFRPLRDEEARQFVQIIESLDRSKFDFLQLEFGDVKLTIGKGSAPPADVGALIVSAALPIAPPQSASPAPASLISAPANIPDSATAAATDEAAQNDALAIAAPLLGRFYAQPEPGAAPFVSIGSEVTEDTTVALIEVMKTFNAVPAGTRGIVTEICVQDAQFVEYGQILFRVRPTTSA